MLFRLKHTITKEMAQIICQKSGRKERPMDEVSVIQICCRGTHHRMLSYLL